MSASYIAYDKYNTNWTVFFLRVPHQYIHEIKQGGKSMCHNKQETNTVFVPKYLQCYSAISLQLFYATLNPP